jgi:hypothetical protein
MTYSRASELAQAYADARRRAYAVWKHVGDRDSAGSWNPATGEYRVTRATVDPGCTWAMVAIFEPALGLNPGTGTSTGGSGEGR